MSQYPSRSSIVAAWCLTLAAILWSVSTAMPAIALTALTIIGLAPAWVLFTLARRPEPTLAEVLRAADQGGAA